MKKLKIYLDTSVISFVYADDSPEKQSVTKEFFDRFLDKYDVYISALVLTEIEKARDENLRRKLREVIRTYKISTLEVKTEDQDIIYDLARRYVDEKVIPAPKFDDAIHIAICVFYEFDILLSWNFRHLANITKQIQVNSVNQTEGYLKELFLLNPMEVIYEKE
jgi:predicted nucleic acid-binding protein